MKRSNTLTRRWRALLVLGCACSTITQADETPNTVNIEELTVTAHRVPTQAIPAVDVITRNSLEARGRMLGPDALATLPGFAISRNGAFGNQAQVRVRGAEANHLQVLVDGIEINDPAIGSEFNFANLDLAGIHRIEYAPGAQSALWGSDAVAGVLNLLTTPNEQRREIAVTGGSFDTLHTRVEIADMLSASYYSLAASHYDTDGTNNSLSGREDDGFSSTTLHFSGGMTSNVLSSQVVLRYNNAEAETDPAPFPISVPIDGDQRTDHTEFAAKLEFGADLADGRWQPSFAVTYLDTENDNRVNGTVSDEVDGKRLRFSLKSYWSVNDAHSITAILEREEEEFVQTGTPSFFGDPNQTQDGTTDSLSIEHIGRWGQLQTSASARFDSNDDFEDAFSFRLAARLSIREHWQAFAAVGTGIKNPSFYERFGFTPENFVGNPDLDPEENQHASIGISFANSLGQAQVTLFRDSLKDEINGFAPTSTFGIFTATNLSDDSDRQGVEVNASTVLGKADLSASYTYLDSEDPSGNRELRRPRHSGHVQLGRAFAGERGYVQIGSIFTGKQVDTDFRTFTPVTLDNYNRVHLSSSYQLHANLVLKARLENALDDDTEDVFMFRPPKRAAFFTLQAQL